MVSSSRDIVYESRLSQHVEYSLVAPTYSVDEGFSSASKQKASPE
jgi:hypothetical protein